MKKFVQNIINRIKVVKNRPDLVKPPITSYSHNYHPDLLFTQEFFDNLRKTILWTETIIAHIPGKPEVNYSTVLRTVNPNYEGQPFYLYENTMFGFVSTPQIPFNYRLILEDALSRRHENNLPIGDVSSLGLVLEFDIDVTTHDRAPCAGTEGFIDESDIPPIDTWFYLTKTHLYCWIPTMFIEKIQDAMEVEILGSYRWIRDSNPYLQTQISKRIL